jgi:hypothetical protein
VILIDLQVFNSCETDYVVYVIRFFHNENTDLVVLMDEHVFSVPEWKN